jgi:tetratricopeptide (TPR) repeat protein
MLNDQSSSRTAGRPLLFCAATLLLAGLSYAAYSNTFQAAFTRDSGTIILADPRLRAVNHQNVKLIFQENYWWPSAEGGIYRPLTTLSYLVNYSILNGQEQPDGYHWVNFLLHCANACLVFLLARRLMDGWLPAFFTTAFWMLHPICTEAVTNVVGRADELAAMSVLGCLLLHIHSAAARGWRKVAALFGIMLTAATGVFSKENAVVVMILLPLYDFIYRMPAGRSNPLRETLPKLARYAIQRYTCLIPPLLAVLYAHLAMFHKPAPVTWSYVDNPILGADFWIGRLTAIKVVGKYFWLLIWPKDLSCDYSFNSIPLVKWPFRDWEDWQVFAAAAVITAVLFLAVRCYRRKPAILFLVLFSAIALLPTANLLVAIGAIMAERFLYIPAIGFAGAAVLAICSLTARLRLRPAATAVILSGIVITLATRTYLRNTDWVNAETLWSETRKTVPQSFKPHIALADIWFNENGPWRLLPVLHEAEKAADIVSVLPNSRNTAIVYQKLGAYYLAQGDAVARRAGDGSLIPTPESYTWYRKALSVLHRGIAIDEQAYAAIRETISGPVGWEPLYANAGQAYLRLGQPKQALDSFLYERRISPGNPSVYRSLASTNLMMGNREEAIVALLQAMVLDKSGLSMPSVARLYDEMDPHSCATYVQAGQKEIDTTCPLVQQHLCRAFAELEKAHRDSGRAEDAGQIQKSARDQYQCGIAPIPLASLQ